MSFRIAEVAVEKTTSAFDMLFSYIVPDGLSVTSGMRVVVPFGKGGKKRIGVIFSVKESDTADKLKEIYAAADSESYLSDEMIELALFMRETTFCTYYDAVKTMLPQGLSLFLNESFSINESVYALSESELSEKEKELAALVRQDGGSAAAAVSQPLYKAAAERLSALGIIEKNSDLKRRIGDETEKNVRLADEMPEGLKLSPKQKQVADMLAEVGAASVKEICYLCGVTASVVTRLAEKGAAEITENIVSRSTTKDAVASEDVSALTLSEEQQKTFDGLSEMMESGKAGCALLHGVTGSGKTSVFVKLIERCTKNGRTAVLLVPEISLTPQTVGKFQRLFGNTVAIIHSNLSLGQRSDEYRRIRSGEARIVIGTRSAVFAPLDNIGIIIIDEEGEHTYKSEKSPRYHARDIAKQRCFCHKALLLLASATPSFDSYSKALSGRYRLFEMNQRYSSAPLPYVKMIDMKVEAEKGNRSNFSDELLCELKYNLEMGEQSMLLLNRRGYHTYVNCISCGKVEECPNCSIPLTYHKVNDSLICHYCGYRKPMLHKCESCGSQYIYSSGTGTQRIEDEIKEYFPNARVLRMDADTTMSKFSYEKRFREFAENEYDIMIGTQMIAKGLDFENVTLVGVLLIDRSLYAGDYLGYEKTFSLITQVVGRSGRGRKPGRAFLQTFSPDHYVLQLAAEQNYKEFYEQENEVRKALIFPPYCDICLIGFSSQSGEAVAKAALAFRKYLSEAGEHCSAKVPMIILGPVDGGKLNGSYKSRLIVKCRNDKAYRDMLRGVSDRFFKDKAFVNVSFFIDFNGEI